MRTCLPDKKAVSRIKVPPRVDNLTNKNKADNLADYADKILTLAVKNSAAQDDMSVIAVRIKKI